MRGGWRGGGLWALREENQAACYAAMWQREALENQRRAVASVRTYVSAPTRGRTETEGEPSPINSGGHQSNFLVCEFDGISSEHTA